MSAPSEPIIRVKTLDEAVTRILTAPPAQETEPCPTVTP